MKKSLHLLDRLGEIQKKDKITFVKFYIENSVSCDFSIKENSIKIFFHNYEINDKDFIDLIDSNIDKKMKESGFVLTELHRGEKDKSYLVFVYEPENIMTPLSVHSISYLFTLIKEAYDEIFKK